MTVNRINSLLTLSAGACCAVAVLSLVAAVLLPFDSATDGDEAALATASASARDPATAPTSDPGEAVWARVFRAPLNDSTIGNGAAAPPVAAANNPQSLSLVGTIGDTLALIRLQDGSVVARGVGDELGEGAGSVVTIGPKGVELSVKGQRVLLSKPQPATSTGVIVERAS
jgi:hypothetical protein